MALRIGTNVPSMTAQRNLSKASAREEHAAAALSSGSRLTDPGDDAAGFAISENLRAQARSLGAAKNNSEGAKSILQVAEGGLNEQNNIVVRLRELATQAASDTVGDSERGYLDTEFQQLVSELDRIAKTTTFGDKKLLSGANKDYEFQVGVGAGPEDVVKYRLDSDTRASTLGLSGLSIVDRDDARDNLSDIDSALSKISKTRAGFGAVQSRFEHVSDNLDIQKENVEAAHSRIADADIAYESSELAQSRVAQDFGTAVLAQANQQPERALRLLG